MRMRLICLLASLTLPLMADEVLAPSAHWRGYYQLPFSEPGGSPTTPAPRVIRDAAAWQAFIAGIPRHEPSKTQPAPENQDPALRGAMHVDFERQMVVIAFRGDHMNAFLRIAFVVRDRDVLRVELRRHALGVIGMTNSEQGIGSYEAVIIDRHDGEVQFVELQPAGAGER
jgi:hypothetical protein